MRIPSILALTLLSLAAHGQELARIDDGWSRYANARFGTALDVPASLFTVVDPPPENGDGRTFKSRGGAELRVFGSYDSSTVTETFSEYKAWLLEQVNESGVNVSYKTQGKDWLVFSGTKSGTIVYARVIEGCGATHEMRITYPSAQKAVYEPVIGRLSKSLRCKAVD